MYPLNTCTNENGDTGSVPKCARGPLHLRRVAMNFYGTPFLSLKCLAALSYPSFPRHLFLLINKVPKFTRQE